MARIAKSLEVLRNQINAAYPRRSKISDGWIGDPAHAARTSDHNPNSAGVVTALDITHDTKNGPDTWKLAEVLRQVRDPRIKYVISNGRIFSSQTSPWQWRTYTGANKHAQHVHVSVSTAKALYDNDAPWNLSGPASQVSPEPKPAPVPPPKGITADMRRRMGKQIVDYEARRINGKIAIYNPPANDGGGAYEIAGINVRYHPTQAAKLKNLINAGKHDEAEASAIDYLLQYTNPATGWTTDAGVEFYLRDSIFNRGPKGAARILQRAVGVKDDGEVGPITRAAIAKNEPDVLLTKLRTARENYERNVVGYRANFWAGLVNRWNRALKDAQAFQKEQAAVVPAQTRNVLAVAAPAAVASFSFLDWIAAHPISSVVIAAGALCAVLVGYAAWKEWRDDTSDEPVAPTPATQEETP